MTREEAVALLVKNKVRCVVFDVDGVLTDGSIIVDADGKELFKTFNVKDGLGIQMLQRQVLILQLSPDANPPSLCIVPKCWVFATFTRGS